MSDVGILQAGSRHDLHVGVSPDAPDESEIDGASGAFGYAHSYETSSRYDGPGLRVVLFVSGCLLRCTYCHNPDTWHLKDGTYVSAEHVVEPAGCLCAGAALARRRPDHLRRRADGAACLYPADIGGCKAPGPAHRDRNLGLSRRPRRRRLSVVDRSRAARYQELGSRDLSQGDRRANWRRPCALPSGSPPWTSRSGCGSRWCRASRTIPPTSKASRGSSRR